MFLLQSEIIAGKYLIKLLPGQKINVTGNLEDYRVNNDIIPVLSPLPPGTIWLAENFSILDDEELIVVDKKGVYAMADLKAGFVYPTVAHKENKQELVDYLINYMLDSSEYDNAAVKDVAEKFVPFGYEFNWDELTKPKAPQEGIAATGVNLRRTIAATYPCPTKEEIGFHVEPSLWYRIIRNILVKENTLLVGPTGSGKTELVSHIAKALNKELDIVDMGTVLDATASLAGVHRLNSAGVSEVELAPFAGYIQKGGIILLDEINRAPRDANNFVFPCLDSRRYLPVDVAGAGTARKINVNEETAFFGTANLGAEYSGTNTIDRALIDRFAIIELDYPKEEDEIEILKLRTGIDDKQASAIVKVSNQIRSQHKSQELSNAVSVRHTLQIAGLVRDGFEVVQAIEWTIMPLFEDGIGVSERSQVQSIIAAF
jgi:MoxR-like ATPase